MCVSIEQHHSSCIRDWQTLQSMVLNSQRMASLTLKRQKWFYSINVSFIRCHKYYQAQYSTVGQFLKTFSSKSPLAQYLKDIAFPKPTATYWSPPRAPKWMCHYRGVLLLVTPTRYCFFSRCSINRFSNMLISKQENMCVTQLTIEYQSMAIKFRIECFKSRFGRFLFLIQGLKQNVTNQLLSWFDWHVVEFGTCFDLADSAEVEYKACKLKTFFNFKSSVDNQESLACLPVVHPS